MNDIFTNLNNTLFGQKIVWKGVSPQINQFNPNILFIHVDARHNLFFV